MMTEQEHKARRESVLNMWRAMNDAEQEHRRRAIKCYAFNTLLEPPTQIRKAVEEAAEREAALRAQANEMADNLWKVWDKVWDEPFTVTTDYGYTFVVDIGSEPAPF